MKQLLFSILLSFAATSINAGTPVAIEKTAKQTEKVIVCNSPASKAYHDHECSGLKRCTHGTLTFTQKEAENKGYVPCKICYK